MDWSSIFSFDIPVLEIFIRGTVMYLALIFLMRVILKRQAGGLESGDILLLILLSDASQNGMAGDYKSVPDGIILVATLMFWNFFLDWLSFKFPWFERLMDAKPIVLVKNGKMLRKNMRKEFVTQAELLSQLREQGINKLEKVKRAYIESDGKLSVIEVEDRTKQQSEPPEKTT
ncbi:DUF421 domain-containing protein [Alkanindiges sp. WGS2144]|uniref:DUF421 domain-containing protein n=1 Tax=Alkanindiges sp. WGS2144 TaxID=3366808 RepID=UPI003751072E